LSLSPDHIRLFALVVRFKCAQQTAIGIGEQRAIEHAVSIEPRGNALLQLYALVCLDARLDDEAVLVLVLAQLCAHSEGWLACVLIRKQRR
jgi:hypothetical protein